MRRAKADWDGRTTALHRSEALLAQAQRLTKTASFWWRPSTGEIAWSAENYRIMEYPIGMTPTVDLVLDRCHPDDVTLVQEKLAAVIRDGVSAELEHRLLMPDGTVKYVRAVFENTGTAEVPEFIGAVTDITEWKVAEAKLRQSESNLDELRSELAHATRVASVGALTAAMAHEVSQPLTGIVTNASTCVRMLASDSPNVEVARTSAERAIRDAERAATVIERLRALFSKRAPIAEPVDLNEATREVLALCRGELQRGRVTTRLQLAEDAPSVTGDRVQLQQVIINLVRNASESMRGVEERPRQMVIRTARSGDDQVLLSVRDSGIGLAPNALRKVFDAFYTTKPHGMGIGLSVSRSIVESHGGRLWAVPNDGPGTTFAFSIPCAAAALWSESAAPTVEVKDNAIRERSYRCTQSASSRADQTSCLRGR